ncbi:hypothetical protein [Chlorobium limicola]|jgi:hypothetical protein|nr:hypothetical protein [Chlorobium limicola]
MVFVIRMLVFFMRAFPAFIVSVPMHGDPFLSLSKKNSGEICS